MLSVQESARILGVTATRVRALIAQGALPAEKVGRAWLLREEDVLQRLSEHRRPGRPASIDNITQTACEDTTMENVAEEGHRIYLACKEFFRFRPDPEQVAAAQSQEEAAFYMVVADFFLQQKQRELVKQGVY